MCVLQHLYWTEHESKIAQYYIDSYDAKNPKLKSKTDQDIEL